jgi:serine/threonine-protein kinase
MSEPGDKSRRDVTPLPRTNRPRPDTTRRRVAGEPVSVRDGAPVSGRSTKRDGFPEADAASDGDGASQSAIIHVPDEPPNLGERPTQLDAANPQDRDTAPSNLTADLRKVPLIRADGSRVSAAEVGTAGAYVGCAIDGRYRIDGVLGRGGMGVVYRARHEVIDKLVAIKILLATEDREVVERFVNEARAATSIGNAHIVDTVDFGTLPDGATYFVMEYLEGETLAKHIKSTRFVPAERALYIAKQITQGMSAAHRAGIVHRDLKPENTFLTHREGHDDFVKLLDFGIAKMQHAQNRLTRAGTIFGTPHYMSPEQAAGREVDPRTDIYSLGVMLYEMLSGKVPFDAENPMGLLTQHLYSEPVPLTLFPDLPQPISGPLDAVVLKCLAKSPDERYATMGDLGADLERVERGEPPAALADLIARAKRDDDAELLAAAKAGLRPRRRRNLAPVFVTGTVLLLAGGAIAALSFRQPEIAPPAQPTSLKATTPVPDSRPAKPSNERSVGLVFSPIDGEVFRAGKNLGGMPVTVAVAKGETVEVEVRRDGFYPEKVRLDGTRTVVVVRLTPIPGVQPRIPVPSAEPLDALKRASEAMLSPSPANRADAGAPVHAAPPVARSATAPAPAVPSGATEGVVHEPAPTNPAPAEAHAATLPAVPTPAPSAATP